ncbi:YuzL family protein [Metabacillus fastidiosus]|uniref:YuzL family protein n=1 Tax=Metabacillus fastidiosus TaxID=1458 RepID=A0ABU6NV85_9BACI|nr:YuzL family protein [Metabacillus fastidiosus]MED4400623.1 YuzL family protein [Metabacillus fastidiosus]MED4453802.1 YuzL family protein [Metabacillus fastidiosus]MED4462794.1 YuzL family protein [Metabacillus fastidiosus]
MAKKKKDPSKAGLSSPNVEGQGTTTHETGSEQRDSARKKSKRH